MSTKKNAEQVDKRLVDRFVSRGIVKRTDIDKALKALPDLEGTFDDIAEKVYRETDTSSEAEA